MPINPNALSSSPEPDEQPPNEAQAHVEQEQDAEAVQPTRKRRTKAEMIADAVVPADDQMVEIKDSGTGAKVMRTWAEALPLVKAQQAEFVDKTLKYAVLKAEQEQVAPAFEPQNLESGKKGEENIPPEAEIGDEIVVGAEVYRLGHGRVLTHGSIGNPDGTIIQAKKRWQRELGSGLNGPWESTPLRQDQSDAFQQITEAFKQPSAPDPTTTLPVKVETEREPMELEQVGPITWKVGTGILEKIGLPDYSSLQVGPISVSRMAIDDGRRTTVQIGSRQASIPTAVIEAFQECTDVVEYVARYQRGELISFLESTGALKQPVS